MSTKLEILEFLNNNKVIENDFDGSISPVQAYELKEKYPHDISFVDIRSNEERVFTGYIQDLLHFTWASGTSLVRNRNLKQYQIYSHLLKVFISLV